MVKDKLKDVERDDSKMDVKSTNKGRSNRRSSNKNRRKSGYKPTSKDNDLAWHAKSDSLLNAAAAIPWSWSTGINVDLRNNAGGATGRFNMPGITALRLCSVPGLGNKFTDAVNIASRALYTDVRRQLKSANAYEAADVMMYILNCGDIQQMISWCTRLYATTPLYSYMNAYIPDGLIKIQNVDPTELHEHATEFRSRINQLIYKASQIWMPKGFDYITRCKWLYSGYYTEGESIKDQIYLFTPGIFRKYTWDADRDYQGMLEAYVPVKQYTDDAHLMTLDSICNYLDDMIEAMVSDSDFQNIAGDLYNCYGASGVETFSLIPEDAITFPVFSEEVLEQYQNARCLTTYNYMFDNFEDFVDAFSISQDETNNVMVVPNKFELDLSAYADAVKARLVKSLKLDTYDWLLSIHKDPSPAKTMLITRMSNIGTNFTDKGSDKYEVMTEASAEIVLSIEEGYMSVDTGKFTVIAHDTNGIKRDANYTALNLVNAVYMRVFHYYPNLLLSLGSSDEPKGPLFGEMDIIAPISSINLKDLNRVDLMSLFAVPDVGKVNK